jgi:hypothetical protein
MDPVPLLARTPRAEESCHYAKHAEATCECTSEAASNDGCFTACPNRTILVGLRCQVDMLCMVVGLHEDSEHRKSLNNC